MRRSGSADSKRKQSLTAFLCHSSGDKPKAQELYTRLRTAGVEPWLDVENLLPGQDWESEIRKTVKKSDTIIICLSEDSINKRGFVQKEIKFALDVADELPEGAIFLIPLKLEECEVPERLRSRHWVEYFRPDGYERLMTALRIRAQELGLKVPIKTDNKRKVHATTKGSDRRYVRRDAYGRFVESNGISNTVELNVINVNAYIKRSEFIKSAAEILSGIFFISQGGESVDSVIELITLSQEFGINSIEELEAVIASSKSWVDKFFREFAKDKLAGDWSLSKSTILVLVLLAVNNDKVNQKFLEQRGWDEFFTRKTISTIRKIRGSLKPEE